MDYSSIRSELTDYYMRTLAGSVENLRGKVYEKLDRFDRENPGLNSMKLKAQQYRTIAETFEPKLFDHLPFYYETGAIAAYGDGFIPGAAVATLTDGYSTGTTIS